MLNPWRLGLLSRLDTLGTIRAVAQDANLSASSVSQQLAVLETETRTRLLERTGRRVRLTPAGQLLARRGRAILDHMDTVEAELRGLREEPAGLVRLGAFKSAIRTLALPAVTRLAAEHPQLDVDPAVPGVKVDAPGGDAPAVNAAPKPNGEGLAPPAADTRPDGVADHGAVNTPTVDVTPPAEGPAVNTAPRPNGEGLAPPAGDMRPDSVADPSAVASTPPAAPPVAPPAQAPQITLTPPEGGPSSSITPPDGPPATVTPHEGPSTPPTSDTPLAANAGDPPSLSTADPNGLPGEPSTLPGFTHEGTLGRQGFDALNGVVQNVGSQAGQVGVAVGLHNNEKDDNGDVATAIADGATTALPGSATGPTGSPVIRHITGGQGFHK